MTRPVVRVYFTTYNETIPTSLKEIQMSNPDFTPRGAAKLVLSSLVAGKASDLTKHAVGDYTRFDDDSRVASLSGMVVGWYVSDKLKPVTNKIVDKTADFIVAKRESRKAKKNAKKED
jgi:hypothetical protein